MCFYIFVLICYFSSVDSYWIKTIKLLISIICLTYFFCCLFGGMITIEGGRLVTSLSSWPLLGNKLYTYNTWPVLYLSCNRIYWKVLWNRFVKLTHNLILTLFPVINWGYWIIEVSTYYLLQIILLRQGQCIDISTKSVYPSKQYSSFISKLKKWIWIGKKSSQRNYQRWSYICI